MKHLLILFMVCSFIEAKEQTVLKVCFYRCDNNDIYATTISVDDDCDDDYDVTVEGVE